ncbi:MAG: rplR [Chlamydiales bacterium]|jgi:large subunit ribosomal protein L18|nr:rplR [Chlamydiales bacterium]
MESSVLNKLKQRDRRALRVRAQLRGTAEKPRLCVIKTNSHIHAQLIDDEAGHTLASVSTLSKEFKNTEFNRKNKASAHQLGLHLAALAKAKNIKTVVFDRGRSKYHGVIAALADAARTELQF